MSITDILIVAGIAGALGIPYARPLLQRVASLFTTGAPSQPTQAERDAADFEAYSRLRARAANNPKAAAALNELLVPLFGAEVKS